MSGTRSESLAREAQRRLFAKEPDGRYAIALAPSENHGAKAKIQIYGAIGDWWEGLDAATLANQITALDVGEIEVHLNSPGGIAFDGLAIRNALAQHDANIHVIVDGLAASAASVIAMAGDKITMGVGAQMMLHEASGITLGDSVDMAKASEVLDRVSNSIAEVYADRAGGTRDEWRQIMRAETWYSAGEAVTAGLATDIAKSGDYTTKKDARAAFDLSIFAYSGRWSAPEPPLPKATSGQVSAAWQREHDDYLALFGNDGSKPSAARVVGYVSDDDNYAALFGKDA